MPIRCALAVFATLAALLPSPPLAAQAPGEYDWSTVRYEYTHLNDGGDPWHLAAFELGARRPTVTGISRLNYASRNGVDGYQLEADLYPIWPGVGYLYLSGAYGLDQPWPDVRLAGEAWLALPASFELSLGGTWLDFDALDVAILTGSLGYYIGDWWLNARPYWLPDQDEFSATALVRRYVDSADRWVSARVTRGTAPENLQTGADVTRLETLAVALDAQWPLSRDFLLSPLVSVLWEDLPNARERRRTSIGLGVTHRF